MLAMKWSTHAGLVPSGDVNESCLGVVERGGVSGTAPTAAEEAAPTAAGLSVVPLSLALLRAHASRAVAGRAACSSCHCARGRRVRGARTTPRARPTKNGRKRWFVLLFLTVSLVGSAATTRRCRAGLSVHPATDSSSAASARAASAPSTSSAAVSGRGALRPMVWSLGSRASLSFSPAARRDQGTGPCCCGAGQRCESNVGGSRGGGLQQQKGRMASARRGGWRRGK